jgi:thiamine biosynthesis lipoprotein
VESQSEISWCVAEGPTLGTTYTVKWSAPGCEGVQPAVTAALETVDRQMSTWRDDSEITAVRGGGVVNVSADTASVVRDALTLAQESAGAFDPTVQPLMEVWGFHSQERALEEPTPEALETARSQVGFERVTVGANDSGPWVNAGGTALDLSSIAKGHAVDRVSLALSRLGHPHHMVEVGGEVRVAGEGPNGLWSLGVDTPTEGAAPGASYAAVVRLTNHALATSGNYRNLVEVDGRKVHHTMDPRTGRPAVSDVASVSVVASTCREADALATAVMVMGAEKGLALLESRSDVEALVLVAGEPITQLTTSGMSDFLAN